MRIGVLLSLVLVLGVVEVAADPAPKLSGTFTNLQYHDDSGDLTGWEVSLIPQADGSYFALVQVAEGSAPQIFTGRATLSANSVRIVIEGQGPFSGTYVGTLKSSELQLTTPSGEVARLSRGSYWK